MRQGPPAVLARPDGDLNDGGIIERQPDLSRPGRCLTAQAEPAADYSHLAAEVAGLRTELAETLGRIEGNLVELYGKTGNDYPWEEGPAGEMGRSNEQRT